MTFTDTNLKSVLALKAKVFCLFTTAGQNWSGEFIRTGLIETQS